MKLSADRALLAEAMSWTALAVPKRPTFPALAGVKVTADKKAGTLTLEAFDFDTGHRASVPAKVSKGGSALVSGHMAAALVGALRGESVAISLEDNRVTLKAGRSTYRLNTLDLDEYPELPEVDGDPAGAVDADALHDALALASWNVDEQNPTQRLRGIRLQGSMGSLDVIGAHSSAVAAAQLEFPGEIEVWLPYASLERSVRGLNGSVVLRVSEGTLRLSSLSRDVFLRLYAPDAIDFDQFLPKASTTTLEVDAGELRAAVSRASLTCGDDEALTLTPTGSELTISAGAASTAEGSEVVDCTADGPAVTISFGAVMFRKALEAAPDGPLQIKLTDAGQRALIEDKTSTWGFVVMPRRK